MEYRTPVFNEDGTINAEINHPIYGWIPFTANQNDTGAQFDVAALFDEMAPNAAPYVAPVIDPVEAVAQEDAEIEAAENSTTFQLLQGVLADALGLNGAQINAAIEASKAKVKADRQSKRK